LQITDICVILGVMLGFEEKTQSSSDETISRPEIVISGQELLKVFNSGQFKLGVNTTAGKLSKADYDLESGSRIFRGLRDPKTTLVYSTDVSPLSVGVGKMEKQRVEKLVEAGNFPLIELHFHPLGRGRQAQLNAYIPTGADLVALSEVRRQMQMNLGWDSYPLGVITIVKGLGNTDMILFQEVGPRPAEWSLLHYYEEDTNSNQSLQDTTDLLENYGFKAAIIPYTTAGVPKQAEDTVKSFAFKLSTIDTPSGIPNQSIDF